MRVSASRLFVVLIARDEMRPIRARRLWWPHSEKTYPQPRDSIFFLFIDSGGNRLSESMLYRPIGNVLEWVRQRFGMGWATNWNGYGNVLEWVDGNGNTE